MSLQQYTTILNQAASNQDTESIKKVVDEVKVDFCFFFFIIVTINLTIIPFGRIM